MHASSDSVSPHCAMGTGCAAALAAWFLAPEDQATDDELAALRAEIRSLRALLEKDLPRRTAG